LRRLANFYGGDLKATDASRILRLPGSINHKYVNRPVVIIKSFHPEREYNLSDFDFLPEIKLLDQPLGNPTLEHLNDYSDVEVLVRNAIMARPGNRNQTGFSLACSLRDLGLSCEEALPYMMLYASAPHAKDGGHRYTPKEAIDSLIQAFKRSPKQASLSATITKMIDFFLKKERLNSEEKVYQMPKSQTKCGRGGINMIPKRGSGLKRAFRIPFHCGLRSCSICGPPLAEKHKSELKNFMPHPWFKIIPNDFRVGAYEDAYRKGAKCRWVFDPDTGLTLFLTDIQVRDSVPISSSEQHDMLLNSFIKVPAQYIPNKNLIGGTYMNGNRKPETIEVAKEKAERQEEKDIEASSAQSDYYFFRDRGTEEQAIESYRKLGCQVSIDNGVLDIQLSEKAIRFFDALAKGKVVPIFDVEDPLQTAELLTIL
jgi:hypothetical protein